MEKRYLVICLAVLILAGLPGAVQSATVTATYFGRVYGGPLDGSTGEGTFTYDPDLLEPLDETDVRDPEADWFSDPSLGLKVTLFFGGQNFNETNDAGYDQFLEYPQLLLRDSGPDPVPSYLDYYLVDGENGVNFNYPGLVELSTSDLLPGNGNSKYDFITELNTTVVPIPGAFWLLGTGIAGLIGIRIRTRQST